MAKQKKNTVIGIKNAVFSGPKETIQALTANLQGVRFTKVINTYVFESEPIKVQLIKEGKPFLQGNLIWLGNRTDRKDGTVFCIETEREGIKQLTPTEYNSININLDISKRMIRIYTMARLSCAVCNRPIEIMDEDLQCPVCEAKAHAQHLRDWIKMQGTCPVCKKPLALDKNGIPIPAEED